MTSVQFHRSSSDEHEYEEIYFDQPSNDHHTIHRHDTTRVKSTTKDCKLMLKLNILVLVIVTVGIAMFCCWYFLRSSVQIVQMKDVKEHSITKLAIEDAELRRQRHFIKDMAKDAWKAYVSHAWGHEALCPVDNSAYQSGMYGNSSGTTILASATTLWVMGLREEFEQARRWIEKSLDFANIDRYVEVFKAETEYVGSLLSCFALTNDSMFLNKGMEIARLLQTAYDSESKIVFPYKAIKPKTKTLSRSINHDGHNYLSFFAGQQLEYNYLSDLTGNPQYRTKMLNIKEALKKLPKPQGLYYDSINSDDWNSAKSTLFWQGKDFYANLIKEYFQTGNFAILEMFRDAIEQVERNGMIITSKRGHFYVRNKNRDNSTEKYMAFSGCYLGATFSLAARALKKVANSKKDNQAIVDKYQKWAEGLTETCYLASIRTTTGLAPWRFYFTDNDDATNLDGGKNFQYNSICPELAESYFILYRVTREQKYRDYAWQMVQAIYAHCRTESGGYSNILNVEQIPSNKTNRQPVYFLSATLKYLYLTFTDESVLPLDQWIFNSQGHPLPICGSNIAYVKC